MATDIVTVVLEVPKGQQIDPTDHMLYKPGFTRITICEDCQRVAWYWDNNSRICELCGGHLNEQVGIWKDDQWHIRQGTK